MKPKIFIDGEAGTTGLQIRARLEARDDLEFIQLSDAHRKDENARRDALNTADVSILCLPDAAAKAPAQAKAAGAAQGQAGGKGRAKKAVPAKV